MMGRQNEPEQLFYAFRVESHVSQLWGETETQARRASLFAIRTNHIQNPIGLQESDGTAFSLDWTN